MNITIAQQILNPFIKVKFERGGYYLWKRQEQKNRLKTPEQVPRGWRNHKTTNQSRLTSHFCLGPSMLKVNIKIQCISVFIFLSLSLKSRLSDIFTKKNAFLLSLLYTKLYLWSANEQESIEFKMIFRDIIKCVDCFEKNKSNFKQCPWKLFYIIKKITSLQRTVSLNIMKTPWIQCYTHLGVPDHNQLLENSLIRVVCIVIAV